MFILFLLKKKKAAETILKAKHLGPVCLHRTHELMVKCAPPKIIEEVRDEGYKVAMYMRP